MGRKSATIEDEVSAFLKRLAALFCHLNLTVSAIYDLSEKVIYYFN